MRVRVRLKTHPSLTNPSAFPFEGVSAADSSGVDGAARSRRRVCILSDTALHYESVKFWFRV